MSFADIAKDPHLAEREMFVEIEHLALGKQRVMHAPWRFSHWDCVVHRARPLLGADNNEVLSGLDAAQPTERGQATEAST
jgi:crotonobetainyl-CoA:carnitine CoA-transferase CaiB-like acyl-CoA transferase